MKTVIIDNSLCTLPIEENMNPELISRYIRALADTGVKYVELDRMRRVRRAGRSWRPDVRRAYTGV